MDAKRLTNEQFLEILEILKTKDSKEELQKVCTKLEIGENDTPLSVLSFDTDKIKEYAFPSPKLPEIRGGSELIKITLNQEYDKKGIKKKGKICDVVSDLGLPEECIIYASGGGGILIVPEYKAEEVAIAIKKLLPKETIGATVTCEYLKVHPIDLIEGYRSQKFTFEDAKKVIKDNPQLQKYFDMEAREELTKDKWKDKKCFGEIVTILSTKLQKKKDGKELSPFFEAIPYAKRCQSCGMLPATKHDKIYGEKDILCKVCLNKFNNDPKDETDPNYAQELSDIGNESNGRAKGFIGVIYADGNGMGAVLQELKSISDYDYWSHFVDKTFEDAIDNAVQKFKINKFEKLVTGGDDIILFLPADKALQFAKMLTEEIETKFKTDERLKQILKSNTLEKMGLGVGVVIAHHNFPALYLVEYAEKLLKLAKKKGKKEDPPESAIDFMILTDSSPINTSVNSLRQDLYCHEEQVSTFKKYEMNFTSKPFTLKEYNNFLENALRLKNIVSRSQIYKLREVIRNKSQAVAENEFLYQLVRDKNIKEWVEEIISDNKKWNTVEVKELREIIWKEDEKAVKKKYITQFIDYAEVYHFISEKEGENSET